MAGRAPLRAVEAGRGSLVAERLRVADTHWTRFRGLIGTPGLPTGDGLWIRPCRQVHMFWMRYPIDVVFLDANLCVVGLTSDLRPWRVSPKFSAAQSVVELPAGTIVRSELAVGHRLVIDAPTSA